MSSLREPQPSTTGVAWGAGSVSISKWVRSRSAWSSLGTTVSRRRKDQGAERDHVGLSPRHLDLSNAAPRFVSIHEASVAEDIVKVGVGWKLDFSASQTISRQIDRHRYHYGGFAPFDIDLTAGNVDPHLAFRNQLMEGLQQQASLAVGAHGDGRLGLFHACLVGAADRLREQA